MPRHLHTDTRPLSLPRAAFRPQGPPSTHGDGHLQPGNTDHQATMNLHTVGGLSLPVRSFTLTRWVHLLLAMIKYGAAVQRRSNQHAGVQRARAISRTCREKQSVQVILGYSTDASTQNRRSRCGAWVGVWVGGGGGLNSSSRCPVSNATQRRTGPTSWTRPRHT